MCFQQHFNFFESTLQYACHLVNLLLSIFCLIIYFQNTFSKEHFWGTASKWYTQKLKYIKTCKLSHASLCNHDRNILLFIQKRVFRCLVKPRRFFSGQISRKRLIAVTRKFCSSNNFPLDDTVADSGRVKRVTGHPILKETVSSIVVKDFLC